MITRSHRAALCRLVVDISGSEPRTLDEQVGVRMAVDTPRRWLHSADMVGIVSGAGPVVDEVFDRLPGCRTIVSSGSRIDEEVRSPFLVHVRDVASPIPVPNADAALLVAVLAGSRPWDRCDHPAMVGRLVRIALRAERCKGATPTADVWIRLRGSRVRCRWTMLG